MYMYVYAARTHARRAQCARLGQSGSMHSSTLHAGRTFCFDSVRALTEVRFLALAWHTDCLG